MWRMLVLLLVSATLVNASGLNLKYPWLSSLLSDKTTKSINRPMTDASGRDNHLTSSFADKYDNLDDFSSLNSQVDALFGEPPTASYDSSPRGPVNYQQAMKKYWAIMNPGFSWHNKAKKGNPFNWFNSVGFEGYPMGRQFAQLGPVEYQMDEPYYDAKDLRRNHEALYADLEN